MSDARAKSEARRAKILARERSQKGVSAIGDAAVTLPVEGKPIERPLAARRNRLKSAAQSQSTADEGVDTEGIDGSINQEGSTLVGDDDIIDKEMPALVADSPEGDDSAVTVVTSESVATEDRGSSSSISSSKEVPSSSAKMELARKKSIQEVEQEIAEHTANFDKSAINKSKREKEKEKKAAEQSIAKKKEFLAKKGSAGSVQAHSVQRMVRLLLIAAIGAFQGYFVFQRNRALPLMGLAGGTISERMLADTGVDSVPTSSEFEEFGDAAVFADRISTAQSTSTDDSNSNNNKSNNSNGDRTWFQWGYAKGKAYFESTITAVSFTYYVGNILSSPITTRLKSKQQAAAANGLEKIMEFFQNFVDGVVEYVFCILGEWSTHITSIVATVLLLSLYAEFASNNSGSALEDTMSSPVEEL